MNKLYEPKSYWQTRLSTNFNLQGVGHGSFSEEYNRWLYRKKACTLESYFNGKSLEGKNVLDVGCGTGFFINYYLQKGAKVYGIDITEISINNLSKKFRGAKFKQIDITSNNYDFLHKFDIINMWDVIYHQVDEICFKQLLVNLSKNCKPGTLFIFTDRFGGNSDIQVAPHVKFRCLASYKKIMSTMGFKLVLIKPLYYFLNRVDSRIILRYGNYFAPLLFLMDLFIKKIPDDNLSLGIWEFN